jgi:hypothetical protein
VSKAERNLEALNALRQRAGMLGEMLGGEAEELGQALLNVLGPKSTRDAVRGQITSRQAATTPTLVGEQVRDAGGITMGQRRVPTVEDLGGAPKPEFDLNALDQNSPVVRRLQELLRLKFPLIS